MAKKGGGIKNFGAEGAGGGGGGQEEKNWVSKNILPPHILYDHSLNLKLCFVWYANELTIW